MPNPEPQIRKAGGRDSTARTLLVAITVSLVCSIVVASASVLLKPRQLYNAELNRQRNILEVAGLLDEEREVSALFAQIEARTVDLATGEYVPDIDPAAFDAIAAARSPATSVDIPSAQDLAGLRRRASYATVYLVRDGPRIRHIILPVYGPGLWSTMYGFIALEGDGRTVYGLQFYEHGETPGLGDKIDDPGWRSLWRGKQVYGEDGALHIEVIKGAVNSGAPGAQHQVDGLAGATLTGRGVTRVLQYWLGEHGFAPFLRKVSEHG